MKGPVSMRTTNEISEPPSDNADGGHPWLTKADNMLRVG
jgi:hypothetical protein